jgi:acetate kinase
MAGHETPKILMFNAGSNSFKFEVVIPQPFFPEGVHGQKLLRGVIEPLRGDGSQFSLVEKSPENQLDRGFCPRAPAMRRRKSSRGSTPGLQPTDLM